MVGATVLALIKISTLVFYKRIFILPRFLLACNITIGVTLGWFLAYIFVSTLRIFSLLPPKEFTDKRVGPNILVKACVSRLDKYRPEHHK